MATINIHKCDVCMAEARSDTEKEKYNSFGDIKIEFNLHLPYSRRTPSRYYYLCEQCLAKIGIFKQVSSEEREQQDKSVQDRLYDIVAEIVSDIQSQR